MSEENTIHIHSALFSQAVYDKSASLHRKKTENAGCATIPQALTILDMNAGTAMHAAHMHVEENKLSMPIYHRHLHERMLCAIKSFWGTENPNSVDLSKSIKINDILDTGAVDLIEELAGAYKKTPTITMKDTSLQNEANIAIQKKWERVKLLHSVVFLAVQSKDNQKELNDREFVMREVDRRGGQKKYYNRLTKYVNNPQKRRMLAKALNINEEALEKNLFGCLLGNACNISNSEILTKNTDSGKTLKQRIEKHLDISIKQLFVSQNKAELKSTLLDSGIVDDDEFHSLLALRMVELASQEVDLFLGGKFFKEKHADLMKNEAFAALLRSKDISSKYKLELIFDNENFNEEELSEQILELITTPQTDEAEKELLKEDAKKLTIGVLEDWVQGTRSFFARFSLQVDRIAVQADKNPTKEQIICLDNLREYAKKYYNKEVLHPLEDHTYWSLMENAAQAGCIIEIREDKFPQGKAPDQIESHYKQALNVNLLHLFNLLGDYERQKGNNVNFFDLMKHPLIKQLNVKLLYGGYEIKEDTITPDIKEYSLSAQDILHKSESYVANYKRLKATEAYLLMTIKNTPAPDILERLNAISRQIKEIEEELKRNKNIRANLIKSAHNHINKTYIRDKQNSVT